MAVIIYLPPGEHMPDHGDDEPWLIVEASNDGRFFGTGSAWRPSGEWVGYGSLPENDGTGDCQIHRHYHLGSNYPVGPLSTDLGHL